jgi:pSer/pThr/pTyr-binding forkhead associated (FHA) protein
VIVRLPVDVASASSTVIALSLLHPNQVKPVHRWTFDHVDSIYIGRSQENDVILYSAVISRHHLELHQRAGEWWAINRGKNGTYINNIAIRRLLLSNETTLCLAKSGPRLQISIRDRVRFTSPTTFATKMYETIVKAKEEDDMTISDVRAGVLSREWADNV